MTSTAHLWAIGYDDVGKAEEARDTLCTLGWSTGRSAKYLILEDIAVAVRHLDGSFTLDRKPLAAVANIAGCTAVGLLAGAVLAAPLGGAAIGALIGGVGVAISAATKGISTDFIREVERMMRPGTSVLFVLDYQGDLDVILHTIRGQGGTVLKTNVTAELASLVQSALAAEAAQKSYKTSATTAKT